MVAANATASATATPPNDDHRYAVDIRVFLVIIVLAMAVSFGVGVGMGPSASEIAQAAGGFANVVGGDVGGGLPKVTSVQLPSPPTLNGDGSSTGTDNLHEPAGQVRNVKYSTVQYSTVQYSSFDSILLLLLRCIE
jgi:hypothetical protein